MTTMTEALAKFVRTQAALEAAEGARRALPEGYRLTDAEVDDMRRVTTAATDAAVALELVKLGRPDLIAAQSDSTETLRGCEYNRMVSEGDLDPAQIAARLAAAFPVAA